MGDPVSGDFCHVSFQYHLWLEYHFWMNFAVHHLKTSEQVYCLPVTSCEVAFHVLLNW